MEKYQLSQSKVSKLIHVSPATVNRFLNGERHIDLDRLVQILVCVKTNNLMFVEPAELLSGLALLPMDRSTLIGRIKQSKLPEASKAAAFVRWLESAPETIVAAAVVELPDVQAVQVESKRPEPTGKVSLPALHFLFQGWQSATLMVIAGAVLILVIGASATPSVREWVGYAVGQMGMSKAATTTPAGPTQTVTGASTATPAPTATRSSPAVHIPQPTPTDAPLTGEVVVQDAAGVKRVALLADDAGVLHLFWLQSAGLDGQVWHTQRDAGGWTAVEPLADGFEVMGTSLRALRGPQGQVCAFWEGATVSSNPDTLGLYARCREGASWSAARMLTRTTLLTHDPFPAWMPDGAMPILYRYGIGEVRLGEMTVGDDGDAVGPPVLAADAQGGLHAAWVRLGTPFCVEYRYSADGGQRWDEVQVLSDAETKPNGYGLHLAAGADGGIHLVWTGDGVFHRRWTADSGWGAATVVSQRGLDSGSLALALDDDGLAHLAWLNWDGLYEVHQSPGGVWTTPVERVDLLHETGINAGLAVSADGARHLVWGVKENEQNVLYYGVLSDKAE